MRIFNSALLGLAEAIARFERHSGVLAVQVLRSKVGSDGALPLIAVLQQLLLVI